MRGRLVAAGLALTAIAFGTAVTRMSADRGGNPNAEACVGQVIAALARGGAGETGSGAGKANVQDLHFPFIRQACAAGESVEAVVQKVREAATEP